MSPRKIVMPPQPGGSGITARTDAATRIPMTHLTTVPPPPRSVKIELTSECNYRCVFCTHRLRNNVHGEMRWPLYTRLVGEMVDAGVREIGLFFIGESFMIDWLADAVAYAKARGIRYAMLTTNGSLAAAPRVRECMEAGLDSLNFSMNHPDVADFEKVAQAQGSLFRDAIANLKAARRVRDEGDFACAIHASSIRFDAGQEERMQRLLGEILPYVDEHYWVPLHAMRPASKADAARETLPCWSIFTEGHITFDGKLSACCFDAGERWIMADLNRHSFLDGWNSAPFATLREAHLKRDLKGTICERCVAVR